MSHDAAEFFDFQDRQDPVPSRSGGWWIVLVVIGGIVLSLVFAVAALLGFEKAGRLAEWADHSVIVSGSYQTMTHDLVTKDFNGIYTGTMPDSDVVKDHVFDNGLNDPSEAHAGEQIIFRGTQTGVQDSDFPQSVDAVLAVEDDTLTVAETDRPGTYGVGITSATVTGQRIKAGALAGLALLSIAATVWGVRRIGRRARAGTVDR